MNPKELLSQIAQNLEKIARERDELKENSISQKKEIQELKETIKRLNSDAAAVNEKFIAANNLNTSSDNGDIKKRIDGLVEEIDECLALLND